MKIMARQTETLQINMEPVDIPGTSPAFPIPPVPHSADPKLVARVGAIGPAPNPANDTYLGLEYYKQLAPNAEVTLPTSECATCVPTTVAGLNTFGPRALADLIECTAARF
jgi:hypothetical protein